MGALIAVAVCAVVAGAWGFTAIGEWARDAGSAALERLGLERGEVDESTLRRLFARLDADRLDAVLGAWALARTALVAGRRVIAIDGKTVRGARGGGSSAPHLVAALAHGSGAVLGQVAVGEKSNEPCRSGAEDHPAAPGGPLPRRSTLGLADVRRKR